MKALSDLDHYEVLEIGREASREEVERAYRLVGAAYATNSLGLYSIFDPKESAVLRERVETAYRVLSDPEARRAYDAARAGDESDLRGESGFEAELAASPAAPERAAAEFEGFEEIEVEDDDADWDGARLRRTRLLRGMEVDQIAKVTKINPTYLRFLEAERFDDLPAAVYVRGFVAAYARCLGLEAERVAVRYMQRFEAWNGAQPRGRLGEQ